MRYLILVCEGTFNLSSEKFCFPFPGDAGAGTCPTACDIRVLTLVGDPGGVFGSFDGETVFCETSFSKPSSAEACSPSGSPVEQIEITDTYLIKICFNWTMKPWLLNFFLVLSCSFSYLLICLCFLSIIIIWWHEKAENNQANESSKFRGQQHQGSTPVGASTLALLETRLQTDWQRQQKSLNPTSSHHTEKSRPFWSNSRHQSGDCKTMDMAQKKITIIFLTEGSKPPFSIRILVTVG